MKAKSKRYLYGDATEIDRLLSRSKLLETAQGGLASVHQEKETGAFWFNCYATTASQGGGYQMLIRLPLPKTTDLIHLAVHSEYEDEAVAAVLRLLDEEAIEQKEFREVLVDKLEQIDITGLSSGEKQRVKTVISLTDLSNPVNKKGIVGKSKTEVEQDAQYYKALAARASQLMQKLA